MLPGKGMYFEILILWSMTESIIDRTTESYLCYNCNIYWFKHILNVAFIDNYLCFWAWMKIAILCFIFTLYFLNTKTNVITNLKPLNSDNNSIGLLLIADLVS